jgi:small subunit ribosomal protein S8
MLTRIRNAIAVRKTEIILPHSKLKEAVARLLKESNFVDDVSVEGKDVGFKSLKIVLNSENSNARITEIARLSTPGRRLYSSAAEIPTIKRGRGIVIVSTSQGLMLGNEAKSKRLGGELICKVY